MPPWQPPAAPATSPTAGKSSNRLVAILVSVAVLLVACASLGAFGVVKALRSYETPKDPLPPIADRPRAPIPDVSTAPTTAPPQRPTGVTGKVPAGSKASTVKLKEMDDLGRVCDRWYYPKSPKYTTSVSPHPIVVSRRDRKDLDFRITGSYLSVPYDAPTEVREAWQPDKPTDVQLVACVDLIDSGPKVKSCKIDKPKKSSIQMKEGRYRLSVYEVATRRKLYETKMTGEKESCPLFIFIGSDRAVYTTLEDAQLSEALRRFVEE